MFARTSRFTRRAFTLVEIMIVVLIIGILLSIAVPQFARARDRSRAQTCRHNLMQIMGAKERWAMDHSRGANDEPSMLQLTQPFAYLRNLPTCPQEGEYTVGTLNETPTCSIGGVAGEPNAHVLWADDAGAEGEAAAPGPAG